MSRACISRSPRSDAGPRYRDQVRHLLDATRRAVNDANWYAALALAFTIPDICAHLEDPSEKRVGLRYERWCKSYLEPQFTFDLGGPSPHIYVTAQDVYALRCAVLHDGNDDATTQLAKDVIDRFEFREDNGIGTVRGDGWVRAHLQVGDFCEMTCVAAERWLDDVGEQPEVGARIAELMKITPRRQI